MANIIEKSTLFVKQPTKFFAQVKKKPSVRNALLALLLTQILVFAYQVGVYTTSGQTLTLDVAIKSFAMTIGSLFLGVLVISAFVHIFCKAFDGKGTYAHTVSVSALSIFPALILMQIPYIQYLAAVYLVFLATIGLAQVHSISRYKALTALIIYFIILAEVFLTYGVMTALAGTMGMGMPMA